MENNLTFSQEDGVDTVISISGVKQFVAYLERETEQYLYCDILSKVLCGVFYSAFYNGLYRIIAFEDIVMSIGSYFPRKVIGDALVEWGKYNITTPRKDGTETYRMTLCHFATRKTNLVEAFWEFPLPLLSLMYGIGSNCENIKDVEDFVKNITSKLKK
jgi:hypothetical protein